MLEWHEYVLSHLTSLVNICDRRQLAIDQEPDVWIFGINFSVAHRCVLGNYISAAVAWTAPMIDAVDMSSRTGCYNGIAPVIPRVFQLA